MTTYDDSLLATRFAALAPEPLAGNWDDVLGRAGVARESRRRSSDPAARKGHRRRFLVVLAVMALVVAVGTASAFGVRALILDQGFVGLAPLGATPSTPESGELEIFYWVTQGLQPRPGETGQKKPQLGLRRRAADIGPVSGRPGRATPHPRGSRALAIGDPLDRTVQPRAAHAPAWAALSERRQSGHGRPAGHGRLRPLTAAASPWRAARDSLRNHDCSARCRPSFPRRSGERSVPPRGTAHESGVVAAGKRVGRSRGKGVRALHVRGLLRGMAARPTDRAVSPLDPATASGRGLAAGEGQDTAGRALWLTWRFPCRGLTTAPT